MLDAALSGCDQASLCRRNGEMVLLEILVTICVPEKLTVIFRRIEDAKLEMA